MYIYIYIYVYIYIYIYIYIYTYTDQVRNEELYRIIGQRIILDEINKWKAN